MPDVFVSYASQDKCIANLLVSQLEEMGMLCWIAPRNQVPGGNYVDQIQRNIKASSLLLLLLSRHAANSKAVCSEVHTAWDADIPIIPVLLDQEMPTGELMFFLQPLHIVNWREGEKQHKLVETIEGIIKGSSDSPNENSLGTAYGQELGELPVAAIEALRLIESQIARIDTDEIFALEAIEEAIEFGAPCYNSGRIQDCARVYLFTAQALLDQFAAQANESPLMSFVANQLGPVLDDYASVVTVKSKRFHWAIENNSKSLSWSLRYAFDRILEFNADS